MLLQSGITLQNILSVASGISLPAGRMERITNNKLEVL